MTHRIPTLSLMFGLAGCGGCDDPPPPLCTTDQDCRMGERCTAEGTCVVGAECVAEQECVAKDPRKTCNLETFTCEFRDGFADECDVTRPCPFGQFCSNLLGRCLDAASSRDCTRRSQCPTGQICDRQANKCIPDPGCFGDAFCEDGEICDVVNHVCRALAIECTSCILTNTCEGGALCAIDTKECVGAGEPACQTGEQCDPLGRCVQCTSSMQCGPGLFCNVAIGRCESNVQCADDPNLCPESPEVTCVQCQPPEVCDARTRRCQAPPMICQTDVECPNDQLCDLSVDPHICVARQPDCLNDLLDEPRNDNLALARELPLETTTFDDLKMCQGDIDWYRLDVAAGTYLTIDARFEQEDGDVDLRLFLEDGRTLVDESRSVTDNERVELEVGTDLTLLLQVFLALPTVREIPYRLIVARDPGAVCPDDGNEPDDGPGSAKQLLSGVPYEARLCAADPDWYVLRNVDPATRIVATLDFVDTLGDLDLELYRSGQTTPQLVSASLDDDEEITFDASYGGDIFLRVAGKRSDTNVYTIRAQLQPGQAAACLDDPHEPNETPQTRTSSGAVVNRVNELSICAGDEDWFEVHLEPGEAIYAEAGFGPGADLDLKLYDASVTDPNLGPLDSSDGTTPRELIARRATFGADYLLRVHGHEPADVSPYDLDLRVVGPLACAPDRIDMLGRGDTQMDPFVMPFPPFREGGLTLCGTDDDWFRIFLPGGFAHFIRLSYIGVDAIVDLELYQGTMLLFSSVGQPFPNHREVIVTIPGAGVAVAELHVVRTTGANAEYAFADDVVPVFPCADDPYEPNDTIVSASMASGSTVSPILLDQATLCASVRNPLSDTGDEDWYVLNPPAAGAVMRAEITFERGDLSLELFSPGAVARACLNFGPDRCFSDGNGLTEVVTFTATTTAPYLLKVSSVYSSPNVPVRPPDIDSPYDLEIEYAP
jgi:hypothetical protein